MTKSDEVHRSMKQSIYFQHFIAFSIHPFIHSCLPINSSIHLFIHLSTHPSTHPSIHPPFHPPIHSPTHSIHPSIERSHGVFHVHFALVNGRPAHRGYVVIGRGGGVGRVLGLFGHGGRPVVELLPLHPPVLEPDLDLPLGQVEFAGDLPSLLACYVRVADKLVLQDHRLVPGWWLIGWLIDCLVNWLIDW